MVFRYASDNKRILKYKYLKLRMMNFTIRIFLTNEIADLLELQHYMR